MDVCVAGTWVDPGVTLGAVGSDVEAAGGFVEEATVLAAGGFDVDCVELGVTSVPMGTLFCRLWRAISM